VALETLENGVVLGIDGKHLHPLAPRRRHDSLAGHDKNLLARHGDVFARLDRGEGGAEAGDSDDGDKDEVGLGQRRELDETGFAAVQSDVRRHP